MRACILEENGASRYMYFSTKRTGSRWKKALAWAVTAWTLGMAPVVYASNAALPAP